MKLTFFSYLDIARVGGFHILINLHAIFRSELVLLVRFAHNWNTGILDTSYVFLTIIP
jgi:hypothetical protein